MGRGSLQLTPEGVVLEGGEETILFLLRFYEAKFKRFNYMALLIELHLLSDWGDW